MIHTVLPGETLRGIAAMHGTGPDLLAAERTAGALDRAGAARAASAGTAHRPVRRELAEPVCALWPAGAAPLQSRAAPAGAAACAGLPGARHAPLARCAVRWGRNGTIWGFPIHVRWRRTLWSLTATARCIVYRCMAARPACASREAEQSWKPCLQPGRAGAPSARDGAALCRAHGTAQVELTVRDLLPDCDPAPLVSRLQALLAERVGGLTLALPRPGALGWESPMLARLAAAAGRVRAAPGLPGLPPERLLADYDDAACDRCGLRTERLSRGEALALARRTGACLHYDAAKHLTCFSYRDETGTPHTVRFAGLRSWMERLRALSRRASRLWRSTPRIRPLCLLLHTQFRLR